jgi:hypothetical protein
MKLDLGAVNPADPYTRFSSYKWLMARSLSRAIAGSARHASGLLLDVSAGDKRFAHYFSNQSETKCGIRNVPGSYHVHR